MKQVEIILKCGISIATECEDMGMEWDETGTLKWMDMKNASPEVAFIDLDSVACVVVQERFMKKTRRDVAAEAAAPLLRSAT